MTPLTPLDHLLALTLAVVFPIRARVVGFKGLAEATTDDQPRLRRGLYTQAMGIQWSLVLALGVLWLVTGRPARGLGLELPRTFALALALGAAAAFAVVLLVQARRVAASERALDRVLPKLDRLRIMLPHTPEDLHRFRWLSLTAGVCEELLYRGFLLFYFGHWLGPLASLGAASLIFGLGHVYQGPRGVLLTAALGAFLGGLYLVCGSLAPGMLLHAAGDMYSGTIAQAALSREAELAREAERAREAAAEPAPPLSEPAGAPPRTP